MDNHGQALIETAVLFMALSVLLAGLVGFTKWFAVREKLLLAAKQGAFLYSSGHLERAEVEQRMRDFLSTGSPALNPSGISVSVHPMSGLNAWTLEIDESIAAYTPAQGWYYLLGADPTVTEKCYIKHAPHYWAPLQPWGGPAVPYGR
jgi:Flp pilus assembly protein TadG